MSPGLFALISLLLLSFLLSALATLALGAPPALLLQPLPPVAGLVSTLGIGLAVGAFSQILTSAGNPSPRLLWSRILVWPVALVAIQTLLQTLIVRF